MHTKNKKQHRLLSTSKAKEKNSKLSLNLR